MTTPTNRTTSFRRRAGAISVLAAPVFFAAQELLYPTSGNDPAGELAANAQHHVQLLLAIGCQLLAGILFIPAFFALMTPVRGRGTVLTHVGGALALLGNAVSFLVPVGLQFMVYDASSPGVDRARLVPFMQHAFHDPVGAPIVLGHYFFVLGIILLGIGLYRARAGYRWAAACLALGPVLDAVLGTAGVENGPASTLVISAVTDGLFVAGAIGLAWWQLTTTNTRWEGQDDVAASTREARAVYTPV